ncbi:ABC transporter substrate-binding protein [Actinoplanes sp. URMC 104]|uniref:ABC transporter substrate-binding protein n=1 Tax=Actinoplanes sp. URMC 104 TaxID=3423409 RepID=UPI003F199875
MRLAKSAVAASMAAAVLLGLAACSSDDSGSDDGKVSLVFRQFDPESEISGLKTAVDAWNSSHPDVQVKLETLSPNNIQQFAREANSGSGPDIDQVAFADVASVANPKILKPLDDYLAKDGGTGDLLATDMVTFEDKTWAVPWTADTMALVYNKVKLGANKPPTTWEELATTAAKLKNGFCFPAAGSATSAQWFAINYYLWSHGAQFIKKDGDTWTTGATQDQVKQAIDFFNGLFTSGATSKALQSVQDYSDPSIVNGLANGTCAMSYMPPATFATLTKQAGDKVTSAPMPSGLTDGATHLGGRALAINRNSKHPDQAWEVIKYLTSAETFKTYNQYPASKATLTELKVPDAQQGYVQQLPHSRSMARYIGSELKVAAIQQLVNQQFSAVYSGQASSADAARAILDGLDKGLKG